MPALRLLASFGFLLSLAAVAQTTPDSDVNVPPDHIRIPVLITDKQGKAVSGLRLEDFKVLETTESLHPSPHSLLSPQHRHSQPA